MADILTQFHATPEEMRDFVTVIVSDFKLHTVAMRVQPFEAVRVSPERIVEFFSEGSPYREWMFTVEEPVLPVRSNTHFIDVNPGALRLTVEPLTKEGLRESSLGARTTDLSQLAIWKKIAKRLKEMTKAGVFVVNPKTGARGWHQNFRYSVGANALAVRGIPILPLGGNRVEFPKD